MIDFKEISYDKYVNFQKTGNTWPYKISTFDKLPDAYKEVFPQKSGQFPYTIIIPDENYSFFKLKGFMIVMIKDTLHIYTKFESRIDSVSIQKQDILYIISGNSLLYSWITLALKDTSFTFSFNSIMNYLFTPVIRKLRNIDGKHIDSNDNEELISSMESNDQAFHDNIKFRNLVRYILLKGIIINKILYQPGYLYDYSEIPIFKFTLFKKYLSDHMMVLTDNELIFIQEGQILKTKATGKYDSIFTFLKLDNIRSCEIKNPDTPDYKIMTLLLKNNMKLNTYFSPENQYLESFTGELSKKIKSF